MLPRPFRSIQTKTDPLLSLLLFSVLPSFPPRLVGLFSDVLVGSNIVNNCRTVVYTVPKEDWIFGRKYSQRLPVDPGVVAKGDTTPAFYPVRPQP